MSDEVDYSWRGPIRDAEMVGLVDSHGGRSEAGWWDRIRPHSLGWVTARDRDGALVGFVNVAWDGDDHAFLIDTKTRGHWQRRGIGTEVVRRAAQGARAAGCEWLHVDFEPDLAPFYVDACGFRPADAGLIHLYLPEGPVGDGVDADVGHAVDDVAVDVEGDGDGRVPSARGGT